MSVPKQWPEGGDCDRFFLSSEGEPLSCPADATNRRGDRPTPKAIQRVLSRENWTSCKPTRDRLPHGERGQTDLEGSDCRDLGDKRGVTAVLPFESGSPVCDYHRLFLTDAEIKSMDRHEYVLFKDSEENRYYVDATEFPCPCHPTLETFGRRINHSRKCPNVKPRVQDLPFPEGDQTVIIFYALRDIAPGEELLRTS
ncbi:hypothetical protein WMY93_010066 [Mugilogobius chulae]|uniref:SET domain-containing protein n=1 Tax=Mugilogobius chulae TaxID=88201 RepID=A0AAW0PF96_9GOBI